jgi:hypothetical protein
MDKWSRGRGGRKAKDEMGEVYAKGDQKKRVGLAGGE